MTEQEIYAKCLSLGMTTAEPEGIVWVADESAPHGYALYVGFQGMALRKYTFGRI